LSITLTEIDDLKKDWNVHILHFKYNNCYTQWKKTNKFSFYFKKWNVCLNIKSFYFSRVPNQPDDYQGEEDCVELNLDNQKWNDMPCHRREKSIGALCEKSVY